MRRLRELARPWLGGEWRRTAAFDVTGIAVFVAVIQVARHTGPWQLADALPVVVTVGVGLVLSAVQPWAERHAPAPAAGRVRAEPRMASGLTSDAHSLEVAREELNKAIDRAAAAATSVEVAALIVPASVGVLATLAITNVRIAYVWFDAPTVMALGGACAATLAVYYAASAVLGNVPPPDETVELPAAKIPSAPQPGTFPLPSGGYEADRVASLEVILIRGQVALAVKRQALARSVGYLLAGSALLVATALLASMGVT